MLLANCHLHVLLEAEAAVVYARQTMRQVAAVASDLPCLRLNCGVWYTASTQAYAAAQVLSVCCAWRAKSKRSVVTAVVEALVWL